MMAKTLLFESIRTNTMLINASQKALQKPLTGWERREINRQITVCRQRIKTNKEILNTLV